MMEDRGRRRGGPGGGGRGACRVSDDPWGRRGDVEGSGGAGGGGGGRGGGAEEGPPVGAHGNGSAGRTPGGQTRGLRRCPYAFFRVEKHRINSFNWF
jgi:hypothetical protein